MNRRRLYRCSHDQRISGVAAGVAEYFDLDPALVRILWVVSLLFTAGFSFLLYIVMAIVVPLEPDYAPAPGPWQPGSERWATGEAGSAGAGSTSGEAGSAADAGGEAGSADATASYGPQTWQGVPYAQTSWHTGSHHRERHSGTLAPIFGVILILMGSAALLPQVFPNLNQAAFWSLFFVGVGVVLVATSLRRRPADR